MNKRKRYLEFARWCAEHGDRSTGVDKPVTVITSKHNDVAGMVSARTAHEFESRFANVAQGGGVVAVELQRPFEQNVPVEIDGRAYSLPDDYFVLSVHISSSGNQIPLTLENLTILHLKIEGTSDQVADLRFKNCRIRTIDLTRGASIRIEDCEIGTLRIRIGQNTRGASGIDALGGCILDFDTPVAGTEGVIADHANFSNIWIPRNLGGFPVNDAQPYRNMRAHMTRLHNVLAANFFHAAELALERGVDKSLPNRLASHAYQLFSDFGTSLGRPIAWLLVLVLLSTFITNRFGGAELGFDEKSIAYNGWRGVLVDDCSPYTELCRSAYLAIETTLNPLSIFNSRALLIPTHPFAAAWLAISRVLAIVLITLFVFALRRRFRIRQE